MFKVFDMNISLKLRVKDDIMPSDPVIDRIRERLVRRANQSMNVEEFANNIQTCYFTATLSDGEIVL